MILAGDWSPGTEAARLQLGQELVIANLEAPILHSNHGIARCAKAGPHLFSSHLPDSDQLFVFNLANNHMMDYGHVGLEETLSRLAERGYWAVGAGRDINEAAKELIIEYNDVRVGILARCETQFGTASPSQPGVAALDATLYQSIRALRPMVDLLIVSIHAAAEMSPWPSPRWQGTLRSFVDAGADVVHGHHAHVPQGFEWYREKVIFYGMGNFCVAPERWFEHPNTLWSLIALVEIDSADLSVKVDTAVTQKQEGVLVVRRSTCEELARHQEYIRRCNAPLSNRTLLSGLWQESSVRLYNRYYAEWLGLVRGTDKPGAGHSLDRFKHALMKRLYLRAESRQVVFPSKDQFLLWYVMFACESHNDAIATALGVLGGELEDLRTEETRRLADEMMPWSLGAALR